MDTGEGIIKKIHERKNSISRKLPKIKGAGYRGERLEQIIASNIDIILIVQSVKSPDFNNKVIDRIIVAAESSKILPVIIFSKTDLEFINLNYWNDIYTKVGYKVIKTSLNNKESLIELKQIIENKTVILWGHSGVGKSSLINSIFPELELKTGTISSSSNKGKHTTITAELISAGNSYIIDTPGVREIAPYGIKKEYLSHYFIDFLPFINSCKFNTCTHLHEPGCAVINALENNLLFKERYNSYISILNNIEEDLYFSY